MDPLSILMQRMRSVFAVDLPSMQSRLLTALKIVRYGHLIEKDKTITIFDCHTDLDSIPAFTCTYKNTNNISLNIVFNKRPNFNNHIPVLDGTTPVLLESNHLGSAYEYKYDGLRVVAIISGSSSECVSLFAEKTDNL